MPTVTVEIPDGDHCGGCKFLQEYTINLVDMMGNETGNTRHGYKCKLHDCELEYTTDCYTTVKKCFWCYATEEEKRSMGAFSMLLFCLWDKAPTLNLDVGKTKEEIENNAEEEVEFLKKEHEEYIKMMEEQIEKLKEETKGKDLRSILELQPYVASPFCFFGCTNIWEDKKDADT